MNKIIAIPLENGVLSGHFGHCEQFAIVQVQNSEIVNTEVVTPPEHVPGLYPRWVANFGVSDVIAGGMGQKAIDLFHQQNISAYTGAPVTTAENLVNAFIRGELELHASPCAHDHHGHDHHHH